MASEEKTWDLLRKYSFKLQNETNPDVCCSICQNIMIEPWAARCGCQYCHSCITNYIKNGGKKCPGDKTDCQDLLLKTGENVGFNYLTNHKILNLIVKCPNESCADEFNFQKLEEHIRICGWNHVICPFNSIGCDSNQMKKNEMASYMNQEMFRHSELMVDAIHNLQNDVRKLVDLINEKNTKIENLIKDSERKDAEIEKLKSTLAENDYVTTEMLGLKMNDLLSNIGDMKCYDEQEFEWIVDEFVLEDGFKRRSKPFYRNSYKMYLRIGLDSKSVGLGCYLMRGEFDNHLEWPMTGSVTLTVFDKQTMKQFKSEMFHSEMSAQKDGFKRPVSEINNYCIGDDDFILIEELQNADGIFPSDSLMICCVVKIQ